MGRGEGRLHLVFCSGTKEESVGLNWRRGGSGEGL